MHFLAVGPITGNLILTRFSEGATFKGQAFQGAYDERWDTEQKKFHAAIGDVAGRISHRAKDIRSDDVDGTPRMAGIQNNSPL
jgi:hypothetical protein